MSEHELKCWPEFFSAILSGEKTFELRKDDRQPPFRAGDVLWLREWRRGDKEYTGRDLQLTVTYVLSGFGLEKDYVVMGFRLPAPATDYGGLLRDIRDAMALGHNPGTEWLDSWVREKMIAAADAIEALEQERDRWKEQREYWCDQSNKSDDKLEQAEARADQFAADLHDTIQDEVKFRNRCLKAEAEVERLTGRLDSYHDAMKSCRETVNVLRAALRLVEWGTCEGSYGMTLACEWCHRSQVEGHARDCARQLALGERLEGQR